MLSPDRHPDVCIAGAGIIGLSLALELQQRGLRVLVLEAYEPLQQASTAAAGMLAANDPENPQQLHPLAQYSLALYPGFLARIEQLSHLSVPFQTSRTMQLHSTARAPHTGKHFNNETHSVVPQEIRQLLAREVLAHTPFDLLDEHSVDPRQLAPALLAAVQTLALQTLSVEIRSNAPVLSSTSTSTHVEVRTPSTTLHAGLFVDCTGAWSLHAASPVKGQMLALAIPADLALHFTLRTPEFYIVPRLYGPRAGRAIVGATVEDAGFDTALHPEDLERLRTSAVHLIPALANAPIVDSWAGLRPASPDGLPLLGPHPVHPRQFLATGHYRNGILLAPATAAVMADIVLGRTPAVDLELFSPGRFLHVPR